MDPNGSLPYSQQPDTFPYPEPDWIQSMTLISFLLRSILILSSHLRLVFQVVSFPHISPVCTS
jgi:hypothetical protein